MKIHLGCGRKILPGYLNCDVEPFEGVEIDKQFNLLLPWPLDSDCAEEVRAVHVWEHFYEWQLPHIAQECCACFSPMGCSGWKCQISCGAATWCSKGTLKSAIAAYGARRCTRISC